MNGLIRLNIGGFKFIISREKLSQGRFFDALLKWHEQDPSKTVLDSKGRIYIDRSGKYARPIIEFLRTGRWEADQRLNESTLFEECDFYGVHPPELQFCSDERLRQLRRRYHIDRLTQVTDQELIAALLERTLTMITDLVQQDAPVIGIQLTTLTRITFAVEFGNPAPDENDPTILPIDEALFAKLDKEGDENTLRKDLEDTLLSRYGVSVKLTRTVLQLPAGLLTYRPALPSHERLRRGLVDSIWLQWVGESV